MVDKKPQRIALFSPRTFRKLFVVSHWVIPIVAVFFIFAHIYWRWELSWELMALIGTALLPFLLPLLVVYVGKIGAIEMRDDIFNSDVAEGFHIDESRPPPPVPQQGASNRIPTGPHFEALTSEEKKMLRTLWRVQGEYIKQGNNLRWGFKVGEGLPDYREFVRGFSTLKERSLVDENDQGLVYLTDVGMRYCHLNSDLIEKGGDAWTQFGPG